jgi:hypothetical protein
VGSIRKRREKREKRSSGNKAAANADGVVTQLPGPNAFEIDANRRKDRNVENGEESFGETGDAGKIKSDATKAEIDDASAVGRVVTEDRVSVGTGHGDALGFAGDRVELRFRSCKWKSRCRLLQRRRLRSGKRRDGIRFRSGRWLGGHGRRNGDRRFGSRSCDRWGGRHVSYWQGNRSGGSFGCGYGFSLTVIRVFAVIEAFVGDAN